MRRETQHVLLFLLGGALIRITVDDTYLRYVRPGHRWLLIAAGAVAVVLALVALARDLRAPRAHPAGHDDGHDGHAHGGVERHAPWLLLAPVLVIFVVSPPALGADAVARAGPAAPVRSAELFPPLPDGEPALPISEFVWRAGYDTTGSLEGRQVALTGFLLRRGDGVELARLSISCCAADARANRVRLVGADDRLAALAPETWLRVRGTLQPGSGGDDPQSVPALTVTAVEEVPAPADPYET